MLQYKGCNKTLQRFRASTYEGACTKDNRLELWGWANYRPIHDSSLLCRLAEGGANTIPPIVHLVVIPGALYLTEVDHRADVLRTDEVQTDPVPKAQNRTSALCTQMVADVAEEEPALAERPLNVDGRC